MVASSSSDSALATLTVSKAVLDQDVLLHMMTKLVPPLQVDVQVLEGKKSSNTLSCSCMGGTVLTQRNTIVRTLCGIGLCNALDQAPYYLLGGYSAAVSIPDCMALASISSWMSIEITNGGSGSDDSDSDALVLFEKLNHHLEKNAFLVSKSGNGTIADYHLALQLFQHEACLSSLSLYPHVERWLVHCHAMCTKYTTGHDDITIPAFQNKKEHTATMPMFFYPGDTYVPPKKVSASGTKNTTTTKAQQKNGAAAQPQQQQQQQQGKGGKGKGGAQQQPPPNAKKQKQPKQKQPKGGGGNEAPATYDICALDIRIGKITKVWEHETADKLFCEEIDLGEASGPRQIASGLRPFYTAAALQDQYVLVLCNLKKRNLVGFPSHGMVLCASNSDHTSVTVVTPPGEHPVIGERVLFEQHTKESEEGEGGTKTVAQKEPEPENKVAKKKIFEKIAPDFTTNQDGTVLWKEFPAVTSHGKILNCMPNAQVA